MAANLLNNVASCSSINGSYNCYSLRSAHPDGDIKPKIQSHENNNDHIVNDYATNCVISEAISDQGSSVLASNYDRNQVEIKSRSLSKGVFNSRKGKLVEDVQGGGYGEQQLQEIHMESDLRHNDAGALLYADVMKDSNRSICVDVSVDTAAGAYTRARSSIDDVNASLCTIDSADEQHGVNRGDACSAAASQGDQHSSAGGGICAARGTADRGCRESVTAKYDTACAAVKAGVGYAATVASVKSAGNAARGENATGSADCAAAAAKMRRRKKFVGVRQRPSGRWVAEIKDTTQKIRMWLGTFDTAEAAARAYDEAACLLRGSNTRTNFMPSACSSPSSSPLASRLAHMLRARQNQNITSESSSPSSPPSASVTMESSHRNPLGFSSSHHNRLSSSAYSHNRIPNQSIQSSNNSAKHYPNCTISKQNANLHPNHFPHNSFHNPYRKTYGDRQQHVLISNQGYSLHEAQSNLFEFMSTKSNKSHNSPLWRSSRSESESSDSDPSPPRADYSPIHKRYGTHLHDHFQILSRYTADYANVHGCDKSANGMQGDLGKMSEELSCSNLNPTNEDMNWDDHKQIFARDKNLISAEDIETLTHDQHSMRSNHNYHHNYRGGGFMEALMGINDDIILGTSEQMESMASSFYNNQSVSPFDFNVEASMGPSIMQVDEFPLINELSGKLEEAEGGLHYVNLHDEEGSNHSSSSSSNGTHDTTHENATLGLQLSGNADGNLVCGINSDLEMKRMRFERRASASLYALNGVHEMAMKQTASHNPGTSYLLAGNSTSTSFNFLSTSPSYMLSSPWKPSSASSNTSTCDDSAALNASNVNGAVINAPSLMPSNSSQSNCPSDTIASSNNSTLTFSNMGSDTSNTNSSTNNNNSDAQSQEAAMWNSWDLAPLCTLVA